MRNTHPRRCRLQVEALEARDCPVVIKPPVIAFGGAPSVAYVPATLDHAYGLDQKAVAKYQGQGMTIAIVDAYSDPNAAANLAAFDARFNLPAPPAFRTFAVGVGADQNWGVEQNLDVQVIHEAAPRASIDYIGAASANLSDMFAAVQYAATLPGVVAINMSWGASDFPGEAAYDQYLAQPANHQPVVFCASAGDTGGIVNYPSASPQTISVGGTTLNLTGRVYTTETAWVDGGAGPSLFEPKNTAQVSADADPNTGVPVYDPGLPGYGAWLQVGGTSLSAPIWTAFLADVDSARKTGNSLGTYDVATEITKLKPPYFHDIIKGSDGIYSAGKGYDYPTGDGSPEAQRLITPLARLTHTAGPHVAQQTQPPPAGIVATPFYMLAGHKAPRLPHSPGHVVLLAIGDVEQHKVR